MNWDAIGAAGELVGALAVVATLVYFARQVKKLSDDSFANSLNHVIDGERELHRMIIENYELVAKTNEGEQLSKSEKFLLNEIFQSHFTHHLLSFMRARTYGRDGSINVNNLVRNLEIYPAFRAFYSDPAWRASTNPGTIEFVELVDSKLAEKGI